MKWLKRILIAVAALLALAAALPLFIPLDEYIPRIEKEVSARLKEPVSIKSIRIGILPLPHIAVGGIAVGNNAEITIGKVVVTPAVFSLLQPAKVIRSVEFDALVLTQKGIDKIGLWARPDAAKQPQQAPQVQVESIRLSNALVKFGKGSLGPFDARVNLDSERMPVDALIATHDGKLKVLIKPDKSKFLIDAVAKSWTLPAGPALLFDELRIKGVATANDADLGEVSARLYGGTAAGRIGIKWQKGLQFNGTLDIRQLELQQVSSMLSPGTRFSGRLDAKPVFSASAASADQLANALRLETLFSVRNGVLHGFDIVKAATNLISQGTSGGETRFDQLSGQLALERGSYRFTRLRIASGVLAADGNVSISPKKELSGRVNAQVKAAGASANVPLSVAGTVGAPLLYPTAGTIAGAAAGTAILGPGFGTSIGAKAGSWAEDIFGNKDEKKPGR